MKRYVIARPFVGGLCYLVIHGVFPFIATSFVPELSLATQFDSPEEAMPIVAGIPGAFIEEIEVEE